jgi:hypothetical protein
MGDGVFDKFVIVVCMFLILVGIMKPPKIPLKWTRIKRLRDKDLVVNYSVTPIICILLLLACNTIDFVDVRNGLEGNQELNIIPLHILSIFFGMAYICVSWDVTGIFSFLAVKTLNAAGSNGRKIFTFVSHFISFFTSQHTAYRTPHTAHRTSHPQRTQRRA